jgi:hypothetical protein
MMHLAYFGVGLATLLFVALAPALSGLCVHSVYYHFNDDKEDGPPRLAGEFFPYWLLGAGIFVAGFLAWLVGLGVFRYIIR